MKNHIHFQAFWEKFCIYESIIWIQENQKFSHIVDQIYKICYQVYL